MDIPGKSVCINFLLKSRSYEGYYKEDVVFKELIKLNVKHL